MPPVVNVACVQFAPRKGEYAANLARIGELFSELDALEPRPQIVHFPETALTGYFVEGAVRELAVTAGGLAQDLDRVYRTAARAPRPLDVIIGFYELYQNTLYNSAMAVTLGSGEPVIRHVHRKVFLPTYGLFDEERFVERGHEFRAFDTPWGRLALMVCEDAWHSLPGTMLALDGAQMVFISAAAPARGLWPREDGVPGPASVARWERLVRDIAEEQGVFVSFVNLVSAEGGKSFPGAAVICGPRGDVRVRGPLWEEAILSFPADLGDITRARSALPLLAVLNTALPLLLEDLDHIRAGRKGTVAYDPAPCSDGRCGLAETTTAPSSRGMKVVRPT